MTTTTTADPGRKAPYSFDFRWRIVYQRIVMDYKPADIASHFSISVRTVYRVIQRFLQTGNVAVYKRRTKINRVLTEEQELILIGFIYENPSLYLEEMVTKIYEVCFTIYSM